MGKIYYSSFRSPLLKEVFVASTEKGVCMVDFMTSEKAFLKELKRGFPGEVIRNDRKNRKVVSQLKQYLKGTLKRFDCPLDLREPPFRRRRGHSWPRFPMVRPVRMGTLPKPSVTQRRFGPWEMPTVPTPSH